MMLQLLQSTTNRIALTINEKRQIQPSETFEIELKREQNNDEFIIECVLVSSNDRADVFDLDVTDSVPLADYIYYFYTIDNSSVRILVEQGKARVYTNVNNDIEFNSNEPNEKIFE